MTYKKTFKQNGPELDRARLIGDLLVTNREIEQTDGEDKMMSLHSRFLLSNDHFYSEPNIYLVAPGCPLSDGFISVWGFVKADSLPQDLKHIIGTYQGVHAYIGKTL
jgi:hypothetical protein